MWFWNMVKTIARVGDVDTVRELVNETDGGPGSGNFGHKGRPGQRGGSAKRDGGSSSGSNGGSSEAATPSAAPSVKKNTLSSAWTPRGQQSEYNDDNGTYSRDWINGNIDALMEHDIDNMKDAREEWEKVMINRSNDAVHEIDQQEAVDVVRDGIERSWLDGWFRNADSSYKPKIEEMLLTNPDVRNAGLNIAYLNYKNDTGNDVSFEEFLNTPITVYRGSHGQKEVGFDVWSSFSFRREVALGFGSDIEEVKIRPIDTFGSLQTTGEDEILVPRVLLKSIGARDAWNEAEHPRENGKFTSKGGGSGSIAEKFNPFSNTGVEDIPYRTNGTLYTDPLGKKKWNGKNWVAKDEETEDGGAGSGNFGHRGRPGQRGGSGEGGGNENVPNATPDVKASWKSLFPADSYTETDEYKELLQKSHEANENHDAAWNKYKSLEAELKERCPYVPKDQWDAETKEAYEVLGWRDMDSTGLIPRQNPEEAKRIKDDMSKYIREAVRYEKESSSCREEMDELKRWARLEERMAWEHGPIERASRAEYPGFRMDTTGVSSYDDRLNAGKGMIAEMTPKEYLERCAFQVFDNGTIESTLHGIDPESAQQYAEQMAAGTKFDMPYLNFSNGQQEGRHRAIAAMACGIEKIPVFCVGAEWAMDGAIEDGGPGSGNFGHKGRPGQRGGSGKGGGSHYKGVTSKRVGAKELSSILNTDSKEREHAIDRASYDAIQRQYFEVKASVGVSEYRNSNAIHYYTDTGDVRMNGLLRGNNPLTYSQQRDWKAREINTRDNISVLTEMCKNNKLKEPAVVFRGIKTPEGLIKSLGLNVGGESDLDSLLANDSFVDSLVGHTFRDSGFGSTSVSESISDEFGDSCLMQVYMPKGTQGVYIAKESEYPDEGEFLLQRGTQFVITGASIDSDSGRLLLEVTVMNQEPQDIPDLAHPFNMSDAAEKVLSENETVPEEEIKNIWPSVTDRVAELMNDVRSIKNYGDRQEMSVSIMEAFAASGVCDDFTATQIGAYAFNQGMNSMDSLGSVLSSHFDKGFLKTMSLYRQKQFTDKAKEMYPGASDRVVAYVSGLIQEIDENRGVIKRTQLQDVADKCHKKIAAANIGLEVIDELMKKR